MGNSSVIENHSSSISIALVAFVIRSAFYRGVNLDSLGPGGYVNFDYWISYYFQMKF